MEIMNKYTFLIILSVLTGFQKTIVYADTFSPEIGGALKSPLHEPSMFNIVFALCFVVALIYVTGLIYSKLNVVGAKAAKKQFTDFDINRAIVLSTTQVGQNRNLHVVEVNGNCYLIGATPNSINLIKELGKFNDFSDDEEKTDEEPVAEEEYSPENFNIDDAIKTLYAGKKEDFSEEIKEEAEVSEEDEIYKKYL